MIPSAAILVLMLYILLLQDIISLILALTSQKRNNNDGGRPAAPMIRPRPQLVTEKRPLHTLDQLWRRMKSAADSLKAQGLQHEDITRTMAEARAEARRTEMQKIAAARMVDMELGSRTKE